MNNRRLPHRLFFVLSLLLLVPSCAINPVTGKRQLMLMSESQELALGAQYHPSVISTFGSYDAPELKKFITRKGNEMGKLSHRPDLKYNFEILDSPVINAFAVPGGYLYFTRGILAQFNNEAELIGVLGHEMGHVTARHSASQQSKQQLGQLLLVGGMIVSEEFRQFADYAMQGMQLLFLKFSRDNETEADRLGVEYSSKIQYDASEMANFFQVLNRMHMSEDQGGVPTFMSTHPDPADRYNAVHRKAVEWKDSLKYNDWKVNRDNYLKMIDEMVYGEDPRQGFVRENRFYHPELKFQYPVPAGWKLVNSPLQVQIAPEDGKAMMVFSLAKEDSPEAAARETMSQLKLTVLNSTNREVNGFPAVRVVSEQKSQNSQTGEERIVNVLSYFIQDGSHVYTFHGVAMEADFKQNTGAFESTMAGFRRLTDPSILNILPERIKIKPVRSSATLADALRDLNVPQSRHKELALLNNMELTDRVERGQLIKTIGK